MEGQGGSGRLEGREGEGPRINKKLEGGRERRGRVRVGATDGPDTTRVASPRAITIRTWGYTKNTCVCVTGDNKFITD